MKTVGTGGLSVGTSRAIRPEFVQLAKYTTETRIRRQFCFQGWTESQSGKLRIAPLACSRHSGFLDVQAYFDEKTKPFCLGRVKTANLNFSNFPKRSVWISVFVGYFAGWTSSGLIAQLVLTEVRLTSGFVRLLSCISSVGPSWSRISALTVFAREPCVSHTSQIYVACTGRQSGIIIKLFFLKNTSAPYFENFDTLRLMDFVIKACFVLLWIN